VVQVGAALGAWGNSGNSTQPHVHVQATDSTDWGSTRGLPIAFRERGRTRLPGESEVVDLT
jgi:murein DD-endopeptidase MepM/ murein hydrolase activator NlpD